MVTSGLFLFPRFETDISPLQNKPLLIAGMIEPVVGSDSDGGINIKVVTATPSGVLCAINPYSAPILAGDRLDIYFENQKIFTREVQPEEDGVNAPLFFFLPAEAFVPDWIEEAYYVLTRTGGTVPEDPSAALRLRVKLDAPADPDTEPHKPGHSHLKIVELPEDVIRNGVDAEWAKNGVPMTILAYQGINVRDTIQAKWGSAWLPPHLVTAEQAAGTEPIVIIADQDVILAGGDSNALPVWYDVHDEVWNYPSAGSQTTTVNVDAGAWRLEAPIIEEPTSNTSADKVIDLKKLGKNDLNVYIRVEGSDFAIGDTVKMTWIGTPQTGKPLIFTQSEDVKSIPEIITIKVPNADVRAIAMGHGDASYVLIKKDASPTLSSKRAFADVIGDVTSFPEPTIRELLGDTLEPDETYATVDITYPGMASGDFINLIWLGSQSNDQPYPHEEEHIVSAAEAAARLITFYVNGEHIIVLDNGTLDLSYRVSNDNPALYGVNESEHLQVKVEKVRAMMPAPTVVEADPPDVLDPSKIFDKATVLIEYPGTLKGDILTYHWSGNGPFGSTRDWTPITTLSEGKPVSFRVDARFVTANIGQYVKVRYTLKRAATGLYSYSATLNLLIGYLVGDLPPPDVVQAPDGLLNPMHAIDGVDIKASYESMDALLDTINLKWIGTPGAGTSDDLVEPGHGSGSVLFHLPKTVVGPNINKTVDVSYEVHRYGYPTPSESLSLRVLGFQDPENELPRPQVRQATSDNVLDLMTFDGNANGIVGLWPFIALKQRVWFRLQGKTAAGVDYSIEMLSGEEITPLQVSGGLNETLLRTELMKLGHSTLATVVCKVAFDGDPEESKAIEFPLLPLTIKTRYDYLTPVITDVIDSKGSVPEGGITFDTQVTVKGTATRDEKVELFDGSDTKGLADVDASWLWTKLLTSLEVKDYHITAQAQYAADPVSSLLRAFTVAQTVTPTITAVTDSKGPVAHNGITFDTSVTVTGKASPNQTVQLYDGATAVIPVTPVNGNGDWSKTFSGLSVAAHNIKAKALYGVEPESAVRTFTVAQTVTPTITAVTDSKGTVAEGGITFDKSVTVSGKASPNQQVRLRDGTTSLGEPTANNNGDWSHPVSALTVKAYSLTALALYGDGPVSTPPRTFTVATPIPPLTINTSQMSLNAWHFRDGNTPTNPPGGAFGDRSASGGELPYRYASSNPNVAEVHVTTGRVISKGNGSATITVTDSVNQTARYTVVCSNVELLFGTGHFDTYTVCANTAANMGGRIPSLAEWRAYITNYSGRRTKEEWCWASDRSGATKRYVIYPATGQTDTRVDIGIGGGTASGYGVRRA